MKIALVNVFPDSNKGACALTWASMEMVRRAFPEGEIALVPTAVTPPDSAPFRHTAQRYPGVTILPPLFDGEGRPPLALTFRLLRRLHAIFRLRRDRANGQASLEWMRDCDLVVSVGGVNFLTCGGLREEARLLVRVLPLLAALRMEIPLVLLGAQFGPFGTAFGRRIFLRIAARASLLLPRDRTSAAEIDSSGNRRSMLVPDSALALQFSANGAKERLASRGVDPDGPTLALVISSALRSGEAANVHVSLFAHLARGLVGEGIVRQVIVVKQSDEDEALTLALGRALNLDSRLLICEDLDPEELSALYGACRMVISGRLHAVLLSLIAGVPAVSLAPEFTFKELAVLDLLGLRSLWVPATTQPDEALAKCLEIGRDHATLSRGIENAVANARARWDEVVAALRNATMTGKSR